MTDVQESSQETQNTEQLPPKVDWMHTFISKHIGEHNFQQSFINANTISQNSLRSIEENGWILSDIVFSTRCEKLEIDSR